MMKKLSVVFVAAVIAAGTLLYAHAQQTVAHAERITTLLNNNAFTHITEIEWESRERIEIEGFISNGWFVEQRFDSNNELVRDQREQLVIAPWGLTPAQVSQVLQRGNEAGMVRFDELEVNSRGQVELEGYSETGREIELKFMLSELAAE